jgi:hypothetical protein
MVTHRTWQNRLAQYAREPRFFGYADDGAGTTGLISHVSTTVYVKLDDGIRRRMTLVAITASPAARSAAEDGGVS